MFPFPIPLLLLLLMVMMTFGTTKPARTFVLEPPPLWDASEVNARRVEVEMISIMRELQGEEGGEEKKASQDANGGRGGEE